MNNKINDKLLFSSLSDETIGLLVHSYNNYLSGMMGFTELAMLECDQSEVNDHLSLSLDSAQQAVLFGKQLLSMVGRLQVVLKPVSLASLLEKLTDISIPGLSINHKLSSKESIGIKTDAQWFVYCLQTMIEFSRAYSHLQQVKDPIFQLKLTVKAAEIQLQLSSPFVLSTEQVGKLFMPFFSSRHLLGKKEVGLAMVKGFLNQMQGDIHWCAEKGFLLSMPKYLLE